MHRWPTEGTASLPNHSDNPAAEHHTPLLAQDQPEPADRRQCGMNRRRQAMTSRTALPMRRQRKLAGKGRRLSRRAGQGVSRRHGQALPAQLQQAGLLHLVLRPDGTLLQVSPGWQECFGIDLTSDIGRYNLFLDRQALASGLCTAFQRVVAGEQPPCLDHGYSIAHGPSAGRKFWLRSRLFGLRDGRGRLHSVVVSFEDFTAYQEEAEKCQAVLDNACEAVLVVQEGIIRFCNPKAVKLPDYAAADELVGRPLLDLLHPDDRASMATRLNHCQAGGETRETPGLCTARFLHRDGRLLWLQVNGIPFDWQGRSSLLLFLHDVTGLKKAEAEQKRLAEQLSHAQRMEFLGRFAGGVAHDFNNILTGILCFSDLSLDQVQPDSRLRNNVQAIREAAERGAALTRQLLAFSRKQGQELQVIDLNSVVEMLARILGRLIGDDVELVLELGEGVPPIEAAPSQIEQILLNLAVNARDAMANGGRFVIRTGRRQLAAGDQQAPHARPGTYAWLSAADSGNGIPKELQERIFEPFFTTKEAGKGTGLGLATVYGIIKQQQGYIYLQSAPGEGATFDIYFPASNRQPQAAPPAAVVPRQRGSETILVADDDPSVLTIIKTILSQLGYTVLLAANGEEALAISAKFGSHIDLLLADVIMPRMNGIELAAALKEQRPTIRVLFMSGYTDDMLATFPAFSPQADFLEKPLTPSVLSQRIRALLER